MQAHHASDASSLGRVADETLDRPRGLARKLTCPTVCIVFTGMCLVVLSQVLVTLLNVTKWGEGTKNRMVGTEQENLLKLAEAKAVFVSQHFGRARESISLLQAYAGQILPEDLETMVLDSYLASFPGLQQSEKSFEHSSWYIPGFNVNQTPAGGSSLEGLLNRSSLMDVPFRATQRQHPLVYLASLEDPSSPTGEISQVKMQAYAAFNMTPYLNVTHECDIRYDGEYPGGYYDPRCRIWYQDAVEPGNTGVVITDPYEDAESSRLTISAAAPIFNSTGDAVLGVVGLDMDTKSIGSSIENLSVIDGEGYAYLLAPGGEGLVMVHKNLENHPAEETIFNLEENYESSTEEEKEAFEALVVRMNSSDECEGSAEYSIGGDMRLLAWKHESVRRTNATSDSVDCSDGDFIVVVTVKESVLLEVFSETTSLITRLVAFSSIVMAIVLLVIVCATGFITMSTARGMVKPVNQFKDVVHALSTGDFWQKPGESWKADDMPCPEVENLVAACSSMITLVESGNRELESGHVAIAEYSNTEALALFVKLANDRGVGIVKNNLGNVHALEARQLTATAAASEGSQATELKHKIEEAYNRAITNYRGAIEDAERRRGRLRNQRGSGHLEVGGDDEASETTVKRQLAIRKFNLARCLAAKGRNALLTGGRPKAEEMKKAKDEIKECIQLTSTSSSLGVSVTRDEKIKNDLLQCEFHLELSILERQQHEGAPEAVLRPLNSAKEIVRNYQTVASDMSPGAADAEKTLKATLGILQQRICEAHANYFLALGRHEEAIRHYTLALIGSDKIDPDVARSSLTGLRVLIALGENIFGHPLSRELLVALRFQPVLPIDAESLPYALESLTSALADALVKVKNLEIQGPVPKKRTVVDLCFVMDCTGSMQRWINAAKTKLRDIIEQTKRRIAYVSVRVAFIGYRDFGDEVQHELHPFHEERDLHELLAKLETIKAYGGDDEAEDVAGGLKLASELDWKGDVRLCILIADDPCHGRRYNRGRVVDNYSQGCPEGNDPSKLLYKLQYKKNVDFYFVRLSSSTDHMISTLENDVLALHKKHSTKRRKESRQRQCVFKTHDLMSEIGPSPDDERFQQAVSNSIVRSFSVGYINERF